jgi:hypothetical protein
MCKLVGHIFQRGCIAPMRVNDQPWLAKAREWLGVPYFMVMGTD